MASGWWDNSGAISGCVAAYQPIGAASLAASYVNLQNPGTYDVAPGTAPTFATATGWTFNGTTQYLTSGYTPPNQPAFTAIVRFSDGAASGNHALIGVSNGTYNLGVWQSLGATSFFANGGQTGVGATAASGVLGVAGGQPYKDGATLGAGFFPFGAVYSSIIYIGCYNSGGATPAHRFSGNIQAVAIYNTTLTAGEVATLTTRMLALPIASAKGLPIIAHHHRQVWG